MRRIGCALIAALAAFALAPAPARAQIFGALDDSCDIANDVRDWNLDQFGGFALDADTCTKMTLSVLKQCETAVKTAAKCWRTQIGTIPKTAKSACKTVGDPAACSEGYKNEAADALATIDFRETAELDCCITAANGFYANCAF